MATKSELEAQVAELEARLAQADADRRAEAEKARLAAAAVQRLEAQKARRPSLDVADPAKPEPAEEPRVWVEMTPHNPHFGRKRKRYSIDGAVFDSSGPIEARCALVPKSVAAHLAEQRDERQRGTAEGAVIFIDRGEKRPY